MLLEDRDAMIQARNKAWEVNESWDLHEGHARRLLKRQNIEYRRFLAQQERDISDEEYSAKGIKWSHERWETDDVVSSYLELNDKLPRREHHPPKHRRYNPRSPRKLLPSIGGVVDVDGPLTPRAIERADYVADALDGKVGIYAAGLTIDGSQYFITEHERLFVQSHRSWEEYDQRTFERMPDTGLPLLTDLVYKQSRAYQGNGCHGWKSKLKSHHRTTSPNKDATTQAAHPRKAKLPYVNLHPKRAPSNGYHGDGHHQMSRPDQRSSARQAMPEPVQPEPVQPLPHVDYSRTAPDNSAGRVGKLMRAGGKYLVNILR